MFVIVLSFLPDSGREKDTDDGSGRMGPQSELKPSAKRKKPDSRDGRHTHRPAVLPPADDFCQQVKLRYGILRLL